MEVLFQDSQGKPTRLFEGRVKAVLSGDTIIIWPSGTKGGAVEREITLSLCIAPRIGRNPRLNDLNDFKEQPFAFLSREYLRKALVSKIVQFTIDFSHPSGREYGVIYYNGKCVNESSILRGWSSVKETEGKPKSEMHTKLFHHNAEAKKNKIGIYSNDIRANRKVLFKFNKEEFYQQRKDSIQNAIVEQVVDGSTLRLLVLDKDEKNTTQHMLYLRLAGIVCPTFNKTQVETEENQEWSISAEPLAQEAKYFTEVCILQKDVQILLGGINKDGIFFGTLTWEGKNPVDELLKSGLGKFQQWSARKGDVDRFAKLSDYAREKKLGVYKTDEVIEKTQLNLRTELFGRVVNVFSGSKVTVKLDNGNEEIVYFGSILAPRISKESEEPLAWESKEFVRKTLIGKSVKLVLDYIRTDDSDDGGIKEGNKQQIERKFYSVYLGKDHIPTKVVSKGLADVVQHRRTDTPSPHYQEMLNEEKIAKQKKIGKWSKTATVRRIIDRSKEKTAKAKQYLPMLKKMGRFSAIVEYVANASRYKIFVPNDNCFVSFTVAGIKCPWISKEESQPFGEESLEFTRDLIHQRNIDVEIETCDKGGNFIGNAYLNKEDIAEILLKNGFAKILEISGIHGNRLSAYEKAVEIAKNNKLNIWHNFNPEKERMLKMQKEIESNKQEKLSLKVTYVVDGNWFYAQFNNSEILKLEPMMNQLQIWNENFKKPSNIYFKIDDLCCILRPDKLWYRVQIQEKVSSWQFRVFFVDFGFGEIVDKNELRLLPEQFSLSFLPPQARECYLALIKVPPLSEEYGDLAASYLSEMIEGKTLYGQIEYRNLDQNTFFLSLADIENKVHINKAMVLSGLAKVNKKVNKKQCENLFKQLLDEQDKAKKERRNMWRFSDVDSSDEEDY